MFGPRNEEEEKVFAVERFRVDVQHQIQIVMNRRGMKRKDLALKLGVSEARISQVFSDRCNLTIRLLAEIFHALGDECQLDSHELQAYERERKARLEASRNKALLEASWEAKSTSGCKVEPRVTDAWVNIPSPAIDWGATPSTSANDNAAEAA